MRRLVISGATGSIGRQAIDVLGAIDDLELVGVAAGSDLSALAELAARDSVEAATLASAPSGTASWSGRAPLAVGVDAASEMVRQLRPDLVLNATVGFAGLAVSVATLESGSDLALANKESLVAGGELLVGLAEATGSRLIPVDSEHASIAQLLAGTEPGEVESITITASGGPFRGFDRDSLAEVDVEQALAHPTWRMGGKISIDSATLMNKGLEVIEAHHLFAVDYDRISVVVHPQSIVHGFVNLVDGMSLAHLGLPDMRSPIAWALSADRRPALPLGRLDLAAIGSLEFEQPDRRSFPALDLAEAAGRAGGTAPTVLNAANEVAVEWFLAGRIGFTAIPAVIATTLDKVDTGRAHDFAAIAAADEAARGEAAAAASAHRR